MAENYENLLGAMKMEEEYRKFQADHKAKTEFSYYDKLKKFGFEDTIVYERAKGVYYLKTSNFKILEIGASEFIPELKKAIQTKKETVFIVTPETLLAWVGSDSYNSDYCTANNIPVYEVGYDGGTIVTGAEDVAIGLLTNKATTREVLLNIIYAEIKQRIPNAIFAGNDILVDGYKVLGMGMKNIGEMYLATYQLTFVAYPDAISNICTKAQEKPVKGMSELSDNINKIELLKAIKLWLP